MQKISSGFMPAAAVTTKVLDDHSKKKSRCNLFTHTVIYMGCFRWLHLTNKL